MIEISKYIGEVIGIMLIHVIVWKIWGKYFFRAFDGSKKHILKAVLWNIAFGIFILFGIASYIDMFWVFGLTMMYASFRRIKFYYYKKESKLWLGHIEN